MANARALTLQDGQLNQVKDTDALYVGNAIERDPAALAASVNLLTNTAVTTIFIGRVGQLAHFYGDLQIDGSFTYTNLHLTGDLQVDGNTILGDSSADTLQIAARLVPYTGVSLAFESSTNHTIRVDAATSGNGKSLIIIGANAFSTGNGNGGYVTVVGGYGDGSGDGGEVRISGGTSGAGGRGGNAALFGGDATGGNAGGGSVGLVSGAATGNGTSGGVTLVSGAADAGGTGATGNISIDTGNANGGTDGAIFIGVAYAGSISIGRSGQLTTVKGDLRTEGDTTLGNASTDALIITSQTIQMVKEIDHNIFVDTTTSTDTVGGWLTVVSGAGGVASASGGGTGGSVGIQAGAGGDGDVGGSWPAGQGGPVTISGGGAGTDNGGGGSDGGAASFLGGNATGSAVGGLVSLSGGQADSGGAGTSGGIQIDAGNPWGGTPGSIYIGATYAGGVFISRAGILLQVYGGLQVDESLVVHRAPFNVSHVADAADLYIGITDTTAPRTVTLPQASTTTNGRIIIVKDESGGASGNNITIQPDATLPDTIDGQPSATIKKDYGCKWLMSDGVSNWEIIGIVAEGGVVGAADPLCQLFAGVATTSSLLAGAQLIGGGNFDPARFTFTTLYFEATAFITNSSITGTVELRRVSDGFVAQTLAWTGGGSTIQSTLSLSFTAPGAAEEYAVYAYVDNASESITVLNARLAAI